MKKCISLALAVLLCLTLAACGTEPGKDLERGRYEQNDARIRTETAAPTTE